MLGARRPTRRRRAGAGALAERPGGPRPPERASAAIVIRRDDGSRARALREVVVAHELAHELEPYPAGPAHGREWIAWHVRLVAELVGPTAGLLPSSTTHSKCVTAATGGPGRTR